MSENAAVRHEGLVYFDQGQSAYSSGDIQQAVKKYHKSLEIFGQEPMLYMERAIVSGQLGIALKASGNMDAAADYLGRAVTLFQHYPENADAMLSLGNCFWHLGEISEESGDFDAAKVSYNQAYAAYRSSSKGQTFQVEVLQKLRDIG